MDEEYEYEQRIEDAAKEVFKAAYNQIAEIHQLDVDDAYCEIKLNQIIIKAFKEAITVESEQKKAIEEKFKEKKYTCICNTRKVVASAIFSALIAKGNVMI